VLWGWGEERRGVKKNCTSFARATNVRVRAATRKDFDTPGRPEGCVGDSSSRGGGGGEAVKRCRHHRRRRSDTYKSQRPTRNLKPTRFTDADGKPDDKSDVRIQVSATDGGLCTSYITCACADVHRSLLTRYRVLYYFKLDRAFRR